VSLWNVFAFVCLFVCFFFFLFLFCFVFFFFFLLRYDSCKNFAFIFVGVLTLLYTLGELGFGAIFHVLVLLSDGFHNLSDVVALGIALWASRKSRQAKTIEYSYGYARTELLGALVNGCFLLSLALYVFLEAIPRFANYVLL
jgi:cation diffusion facilitator family transporter